MHLRRKASALNYRLRSRFSEWMWTARPTLPQRIARRLPMYLVDPDYVTQACWDALADKAEWTVGPPMVVIDGTHPMTWTTSSASTVRISKCTFR